MINDLVNFEVRVYALACDMDYSTGRSRGHTTRYFDSHDEAREHAAEMAEAFGEDVVYLIRCESLPFPARRLEAPGVSQ